MTQTDTAARIHRLVAGMLPLGGEITDETPLFYVAAHENNEAARARGEAGLDSLDRMELVMMVEEEFEIEIEDEDVMRAENDTTTEWNTVGGIAAYVDRRRAAEKE